MALDHETRKGWTNHTGNQSANPLRIYTPRKRSDLVEIVLEAEAAGTTVRAIGSSHSWSDIAVANGFLVLPNGLDRVLDLEPALLRDGVDTDLLVRVQSGIRLRELNTELDGRGLGLINMGGYDAQTVAGVMSTSTHGSGLAYGPLCDFAASIDVVGSQGALYRVEPSDGITDPAKFSQAHPNVRLVQDDAWFAAARVGLGCQGMIFAVTLRVRKKYWLKEVRWLRPWSLVREDLRAGKMTEHDHYEVYFNPYPGKDGDHRCLVTTREEVPPPGHEPDEKTRRNLLTEISVALLTLGNGGAELFKLFPDITPDVLDLALKSLVDEEYTNVSYKVYNIGEANHLPAYSMEIGVPVRDGLHVQAVERIMTIAAQRRMLGRIYHTSPVALRFVKASTAHLSMMEGRDTMMIELILVMKTEGGFELLGAYEDALYALGGRPHWGQVNTLTHARVRDLYPRLDDWKAVHEVLNGTGVFNSPFSKRVGLVDSANETPK